MLVKLAILAFLITVIYLVITYMRSEREENRERMEEYLARQGCRLISMNEVLLHLDWDEPRNRAPVYEVTYINAGGRQYTGRFRIPLMGGIEPLDD